MKCKKLTALGLVLSVLLVCTVTVAFATNPADPIDEPAPAETEIVENTPEPAGTEPVENEPMPAETEPAENNPAFVMSDEMIETIREQFQKVFQEQFGTPMNATAQADCTHPNIDQGEPVVADFYDNITSSGHRRIIVPGNKCPDCKALGFKSEEAISRTESHSFGSGTYVGSNHTAADPGQHYLIFSHQCLGCLYSTTYTTWSGCRAGNCVDFNSVTPEPEVSSVAPGEELDG